MSSSTECKSVQSLITEMQKQITAAEKGVSFGDVEINNRP